jgi:hypothetical protein
VISIKSSDYHGLYPNLLEKPLKSGLMGQRFLEEKRRSGQNCNGNIIIKGRNNIVKAVYRMIFIIEIMLMFFVVIGGFLSAHYNNYISVKAVISNVTSYDGAEDYPVQLSYAKYRQYVEEKLFGNSVTHEIDTTENNVAGFGMIEKLNSIVDNIEEKIENYTNYNGLISKYSFVEAKKYVEKAVGLDMTVSLSAQTNSLTDATDVVVKTKEGQLGWVQDDTDISEPLDNLIVFGLDMKAEGRNFIFFQNPGKYEDSIPYTDYSEKYNKEIADAFNKYLLDIFDCGEALTDLGLTESEMFYNTDHHWKASTGILADKLLCEYLNDNYGYEIDVSNFEMDQYATETYEDIFLGSLGKKISTVYAEPEDFVIYFPAYDTNLVVYNSVDDSTKSGTVSDTLFDYKALENNNLYESNPYGLYGYGDQAVIKVHNNLVNDGSHILMIKTSFGDCMIPYLATVVEDLEVIDLRCFNGSIRSYIDETNPDTVIVLSGLSQMETASAENGAFDFR